MRLQVSWHWLSSTFHKQLWSELQLLVVVYLYWHFLAQEPLTVAHMESAAHSVEVFMEHFLPQVAVMRFHSQMVDLALQAMAELARLQAGAQTDRPVSKAHRGSALQAASLVPYFCRHVGAQVLVVLLLWHIYGSWAHSPGVRVEHFILQVLVVGSQTHRPAALQVDSVLKPLVQVETQVPAKTQLGFALQVAESVPRDEHCGTHFNWAALQVQPF